MDAKYIVHKNQRSLFGIFVWPLVLFLLSSVGLLLALVAEGVWDIVAVSLIMPCIVVAWFKLANKKKHRKYTR
tara:strand:- start:5664 stop:5882 length:219 start_codon:yes stop_codon:yes gene_type:complete